MPTVWIAVSGSLDQRRADLSIRDADTGLIASKKIGRALADHGFGIVVYSSDPGFIETSVVAGYISGAQVEDGSIRVVYPRQSDQPQFAEQVTKPSAFLFQKSDNSNWEVSFYRSIEESDAVVLIGGGHSTLVAGTLSLLRTKPIIALDSCGGASSHIWEMISPNSEYLAQSDKLAMAEPLASDDLGSKVADSLKAQISRIDRARHLRWTNTRRKRRSLLFQAMLGIALLALSLVLFIATWDANVTRLCLLSALVIAPLLSGASASLLRSPWDSMNDVISGASSEPILMALFGAGAGGISGLLYVVAQLTALAPTADGNLPNVASRLVPFALITGFLAGFAADAFFRKLKNRNIADVEVPPFMQTH